MSLLMDALKRAEAAKQEAARAQFGANPATPDESPLSLEPIGGETGNSTPPPLPDLATYIEVVDADLASTPLPQPTRTTAQEPAKTAPRAASAAQPQPGGEAARAAVRNAFSAKQAAAETPPSRAMLWLVVGILGVAGTGIAGYVWYQLNALNRSTQVAPTSPRPPAAPPPAAPVVMEAPVVAPVARPDEAPPRVQRKEAVAAPAARSVAETSPAIRLTRTRPEVDPGLLRGHASLQRGELETARREFEQAVQRDRNNTDALLALATIAQSQGRTGDAETLRQRALVANPGDPATQAAILGGKAAEADPQGTESRLKSLLSAQPESAALNFALGNLYSRQGRWPEAQQAYFNAVAVDGDNPDYLFNLAVSLDHLRQARLAGQHYRLALEAAARRPAAFDRTQVERRLGELTPEQAH